MSESILDTQPSTTLPVVELPNTTLDKKLKAVSSMIRNCLLTANTKLKEIDFNALQMFVPLLIDNESTFNGQVIIKATAGAKYKLETRQTFVFTRLDADEYLTSLGFADRTFDKSQFMEVSDWLSAVGTVELVSGDLSTEVGDVTAVFYFGERYRTIIPGRFIDLGSDTFNKADLGVVIRNKVRLTFKGKEDLTISEPVPENDDDLIDIAPFFVNRHLGNVFAPGGKEDTRTISRPPVPEDSIRY